MIEIYSYRTTIAGGPGHFDDVETSAGRVTVTQGGLHRGVLGGVSYPNVYDAVITGTMLAVITWGVENEGWDLPDIASVINEGEIEWVENREA